MSDATKVPMTATEIAAKWSKVATKFTSLTLEDFKDMTVSLDAADMTPSVEARKAEAKALLHINKLKCLLEGLGVTDIEEAMKLDAETLKRVGEAMKQESEAPQVRIKAAQVWIKADPATSFEFDDLASKTFKSAWTTEWSDSVSTAFAGSLDKTKLIK